MTPEDSLALNGNFLTGYNLPLQLDKIKCANNCISS
uniref:Uncharacterized protein n=1 Tax=Physcomitrium patens TaxID=3218 RepID=A0A2K1JCT1_PHYPA|nr:hypothetical protein PHYPA_019612 [Physcomitrium patens]